MSMEIHRGFKYSLRPTKKQARTLSSWAGACGFVYNSALEHRKICYQSQNKKSVPYKEQRNCLPEIKQCEGFEWPKEVSSQGLQAPLRNLDTAFKNFFKGIASFPTLKKKGKCVDSIVFPQGNRTNIVPNLGMARLKERVRFRGKINSAIFQRTADRWFVSI